MAKTLLLKVQPMVLPLHPSTVQFLQYQGSSSLAVSTVKKGLTDICGSRSQDQKLKHLI